MSRTGTRVHLSGPLAVDEIVDLSGDALQHLRARRLRPGAELTVFDGNGGEYRARLETLERREATVRLLRHEPREAEPPLPFVLLQGIAKGDRMDLAVQKAVELGITRIVPVFTEHTVVRLDGERMRKRQTHWQRVAVSACEQCGRNRVPAVDTPVSLDRAWEQVDGLQGVVLDPANGCGVEALPPPAAGIALLVGPEGGLSDTEVAAATNRGFEGLGLGPRVLRTETATLAALAVLQARFGDLA
ncbi:16S rRNA (uracil(1498)-N(3))-methyltransferase [Arhodomonas sp. AD133]|uniref:16S rRNA (uracil(1498)-N(3))-methyltransferase n=1 Tax=Arhodomonas sp. AD133 TaxID=3415009 RepID=UPI003EBDC54A